MTYNEVRADENIRVYIAEADRGYPHGVGDGLF